MRIQTEYAGQPSEVSHRVFVTLAHSVATGALAGIVAGLIAGGVGSRIAMRIIAITADSSLQGTLTDAEATAGEIIAGGTFFLIIFGGLLFGTFGGLVYLALRPWVAGAGRWRGLTFGVLLLAMFVWALIEGDNPDFRLFGSPTLNIAIFASLFIFFGLLVAPLFDWLQRVMPPPLLRTRLGVLPLPTDYLPRSLAALGFDLFVAVMIVVGLVGSGFGEDGDNQVFFKDLPAYVLFALPIAAMLLARVVAGSIGSRTSANTLVA